MTRTIVIGDVHGCNETLRALLRQLRLRKADTLVFLGDYIDRGPDSKGVIDTVQALRRKGHAVTCLRGNHEQMLLDALNDPNSVDSWLRNGGFQTLDSFGISHPRELPDAYAGFLYSTEYWYETQGFLCVHGGLNFRRPDPLLDRESMLWERGWYRDIDYGWLGERVILHGHTPVSPEETRAQWEALDRQRYLNLDTGCVYAPMTRSGLGFLSAFCLETRALTMIPYAG